MAEKGVFFREHVVLKSIWNALEHQQTGNGSMFCFFSKTPLHPDAKSIIDTFYWILTTKKENTNHCSEHRKLFYINKEIPKH